MAPRKRRAQALVETAVTVPLLLLVAFGAIGIGRLTQVHMGLVAATREAARATVQSDMPPINNPDDQRAGDQAVERGRAHGESVARDYGLNNVSFDFDAQNFAPGSWVTVRSTYVVRMTDLPLIRDALSAAINGRGIELHASQTERVDPHRSFSP